MDEQSQHRSLPPPPSFAHGLVGQNDQGRQDIDIEAKEAVGAPLRLDQMDTRFIGEAKSRYPEWLKDPECPFNWSPGRKALQMIIASVSSFTASMATSIISPSQFELIDQFGITTTQSLLPVSLYLFALALGPVIAGPLSETLGRVPVYVAPIPLGALFTLGAGFSQTFAGVCICRFLAGFVLASTLVIPAGTINEMYLPQDKAIPSALFILCPFLGPAIGPIIGAYATSRKGWQWTQWVLIFFFIASMLCCIGIRETFHPKIKRRLARQRAQEDTLSPLPPLKTQLRHFLTITILRPLQMLFTEPIVGFICLYVSCMFATLYCFFAAVPYVFGTVYHFTLEQIGLVFLSIAVGCVLGMVTLSLCNKKLYMKQVPKYPPNQVPPEYRLYASMVGSFLMPIGLFWFAWTAREDVSWVSPVMAIVPFAWGNLCLFVGTLQFKIDTYNALTVASATSANSLARYVFAGAFPLFTVQMFQRLGINWATSLLGFISLALLPVPWVLFRFGPSIRARSRPEWTKQ